MSEIDKLKKANQNLTDLYETEKERADNAQQTLADFWRREPLVHLMWSEILLLRRILEQSYNQNSVIIDLPTTRASQRPKTTALSHRDRLATAALKVFNEKGTDIDAFLQSGAASQAIATPGMSQSPAATLAQQQQQHQAPLAGNSDALSQQLAQQQSRISQLEQYINQLQDQHQKALAAASASGVPPPPGPDGGAAVPPPPGPDGAAVPPPPGPDGAAVPPPPGADGAAPAPAAAAAAIPPAPVLPGFVGAAGAGPAAGAGAAAGGAPTTLEGGIPIPPVLTGFTAKYPGQSAGGAGASADPVAAVAAAPPPDPGPQPTKPMIKPAKKMKALHWKPIITGAPAKQTDLVKSSIWVQVDKSYSSAVREISTAELDENFANAVAKVKGKGPGGPGGDEASAPVSDKPQRLLDPNRHNQLSIMLSKMPKLPEMKKALLTLDNTVLKPEHVESLHKNMFTSEDVELIRGSGLSKDKLMLPEQWILEMSTIPQLAARIECWRFSQVFNDEYVNVVRPLARVETACREILSSVMLRNFFTYILVVGNYLNGGTARGRADGFNLESLSKLFRIKCSDGQSTLIDWLVQFMNRKYGDDCTAVLRQELSVLPEIKTHSLRQTGTDAKKLLGKINLTMKMQSLVVAQNIPGDRFEAVLGEFGRDAEHKVKALDQRATTVLKSFYDVVAYLEPDLEAADLGKIQSEEWLPLLDEFVVGVINSHQQTIKRAEEAERQAKSAAQLAQLKKNVKGGAGGAPAEGGADPAQELQGGFPVLRKANRPAPPPPGGGGDNPQNELANGFPVLRKANREAPAPPGAAPDDSNGGMAFPKLRKAGPAAGANDLPAPPAENGGMAFPKLRKAGGAPAAPAPANDSEQPAFLKAQLKPTKTKTAQTQTEEVSAATFDDAKRPTAKSNIFLKAQKRQAPNVPAPLPEAPQDDMPPPPPSDDE